MALGAHARDEEVILECSRCGMLSGADVQPGAYGLWQCAKCDKRKGGRVPDWDGKEFRQMTGHKPTKSGDWVGSKMGRKVKKSRGFGALGG